MGEGEEEAEKAERVAGLVRSAQESLSNWAAEQQRQEERRTRAFERIAEMAEKAYNLLREEVVRTRIQKDDILAALNSDSFTEEERERIKKRIAGETP